MLMHEIKLFPPMLGVIVDLDKVPDQVFSERMVGDGVAIDPIDNIIYAPINGTIKTIHKAKHAITIESEYGFDVLIHIGLDTVNLAGNGFTLFLKEGDVVKTGYQIMAFDFDYLSQHAKTLISPILICDIENTNIQLEFISQQITRLDRPIMLVKIPSDEEVAIEPTANVSNDVSQIEVDRTKQITNNDTSSLLDDELGNASSELITIINPTGIHARPAALLNQQARKFHGEIYIEKQDKKANLKSVVAILGLSIQVGDQVKIVANGRNAGQFVESISEIVRNLYEADAASKEIAPVIDLNIKQKILGGNYYSGIVAASGLAIGKLVKNPEVVFDFVENCDSVDYEILKLSKAMESARNELENSIASAKKPAYKDVLNAHLMILTDPELLDGTISLIKKNKTTAALAWFDTINLHCKILEDTGVELLKQRRNDLKDVCKQVLNNIRGIKKHVTKLGEASILLAGELTPSDIINLDENVVGLLSINGGATSHVAILAKAKGIPLLVGLDAGLLGIQDGIEVVVDANAGFVNIAPNADDINAIKDKLIEQQANLDIAVKYAALPCATIDNVRIDCYANIANQDDVDSALRNGADGVGLFRTEFLFLEQDMAPSAQLQLDTYNKIASGLGDKPFVLRTLDSGGDKEITYLNMPHETNPVLGARGIRLCLEHPELFKTQLTAALQVNAKKLKIMLPMVNSLDEYRITKSMINQLQRELGLTNHVELGVMIEVPSAAIMADLFAREVDFFSIGTNDLTQYTLAIDRENTQLAKKFDHLEPAVLRNIVLVVDGAAKYEKPVSVCGMMASEKLAIPVLLGLGITQLSMDIHAIADNKALIRKLDVRQCEYIALECLYLSNATEVRALLTENFGYLIG